MKRTTTEKKKKRSKFLHKNTTPCIMYNNPYTKTTPQNYTKNQLKEAKNLPKKYQRLPSIIKCSSKPTATHEHKTAAKQMPPEHSSTTKHLLTQTTLAASESLNLPEPFPTNRELTSEQIFCKIFSSELG